MAKPSKPKAKAAKAAKPAKKKAALPLPTGIEAPKAKAPKRVSRAEAAPLASFEPSAAGATAEVLDRLWTVIEQRRASGDVENSHSARLLARGTAKVAQKLGEEAVECVIEAVAGNRAATVAESADVLYHLLVVWVDAGINPGEVWTELHRREGISGIAEKAARPKALVKLANTKKLP
ncbi:phosphoribosyl-ATP diphosphatase [Rhodovarius crocodyli]|uniref:Phosphoribosyl-ATP pyrophosphatase n=1 Tax=Rhodovarius crocodyli TaxID=1979269 RepID=A0A437MNG3_9PROT|nr:phosphoribosyl-ATP diphosphatase [Rhodovarius crocodyli]RVT99177.1 phosphoribosyl-ATP diphosphatase [Rhodovarius crocodyli]